MASSIDFLLLLLLLVIFLAKVANNVPFWRVRQSHAFMPERPCVALEVVVEDSEADFVDPQPGVFLYSFEHFVVFVGILADVAFIFF